MHDKDIQLLIELRPEERSPTSDEVTRQWNQLLTLIEARPGDSRTRPGKRRLASRRSRLVAALGATVLALGIAVTVVATRPAVAQIEVEQVDGFYEITILELGEDSSQIESELAALGVDITIDFVPVSPSLEGGVVGLATDEEIEPVVDAETGQLVMLRVPVDWEGRGLIEVGRPALSGESYDSSASPLATEEVLEEVACDAIFNQPIEDVARLLSDRGLDIDIRWDYDFESHQLTLDEASGMVVVQVGYTAPDVIQVWVDPEPVEISEESLSESIGGC